MAEIINIIHEPEIPDIQSGNVRFDINPHIVRQLGGELVPDDITALMELVKNAYDADSPYVRININTQESYGDEKLKYPNNKGYIIIEDGGFGMNETVILKSWLTISYSQKRADENNVKPKTPLGRTPLGDKGLGRLSTQRLADCCEIFTCTDDSIEKLHVAFDWREFDKADQLSKVPVFFDRIPTSQSKGTKLILTNLHRPSTWEGDELAALKGQLSQLISPFVENRPFQVYMTVNGESINIVQEFADLINVSLANYSFTFDGKVLEISGTIKAPKLIGNNAESKDNYRVYIESDNGKKFANYFLAKKNDSTCFIPTDGGILAFKKRLSILSDVPGLKILDGKKCDPGSFHGNIYDFSLNNNKEGDESIFNSFSEYKAFIKSQTGIKIYRDGFSVFPYGLGDNDWLGLRTGTTSGSSFYGLRSDNTVGFFAISEGVNSNLKDKTDRTGFIKNEYSDNFFVLAKRIVDESNSFVERIRRTYNEYIKENKQTSSKIKTISEAYSLMNDAGKTSVEIYESIEPIKKEISSIHDKAQRMYETKKEGSLFSKEEDKEVSELLNEVQTLLAKANTLLVSVEGILRKSQQLGDVLDIIKPKIDVLEQQLQDFSELAAIGLTSESITHELGQIIERLSDKNRLFRNKMAHSQFNENEARLLSGYINTAINGLKVQLKHIDPTLRYTKEQKEQIELTHFFESEEMPYFQNSFEAYDIKYTVVSEVNFSITINKGRLIQIIDNIINNSLYWIKVRKEQDPSYAPQISIVIDKPWIYIYDNGYGIANSVEDSLFEPFVTTKPRGKGRGLGLFIISQLLDAVGCSIMLEQRRNEYNKRYIFAINLSNVLI